VVGREVDVGREGHGHQGLLSHASSSSSSLGVGLGFTKESRSSRAERNGIFSFLYLVLPSLCAATGSCDLF
jgi:hypothetical protein